MRHLGNWYPYIFIAFRAFSLFRIRSGRIDQIRLPRIQAAMLEEHLTRSQRPNLAYALKGTFK